MTPLIGPDNAWIQWALISIGAALSIFFEQRYRWAAKLSGPVVALLLGMALSNSKLMPSGSPTYDFIDDYLVPVAIPLLLFRANLERIFRLTGPMFLTFHIASAGTIVGAFLAAALFRGAFDRVPEVAGIMTGSYIGGAVNFIAIRETYHVSAELANPLLVADNFIMAGMFAALLVFAGHSFFRRHYPHPHSAQGDREDVVALAARHWQRKTVSLLDLAQAMAAAVGIAALAVGSARWLKADLQSRILESIFTNPFIYITLFSVLLSTVCHRWTEQIQGAEELGMYLLYLFFFVIGLRADLLAVVRNVPVLFLFCLVMALTNLLFTLIVGKILGLNLEELLLSVNATLGGAPSAAAMAISRGWSNLILPGLLAGIWGYVIGTFLGILVAELLGAS